MSAHKPLFPVTFSLAALAFFSATLTFAQDKTTAGAVFSKQATSKEVGLPVYPGAQAHKDESSDTPSVNLGLWAAGIGFRVAVMKLDSKDSPAKVAAFYQKALGRYGKVLNCTNPAPSSEEKKSSGALTCDDDKADEGGTLFKAGTEHKQHLVEVKPSVNGSTVFSLVYLEMSGTDKKEPL